ncbi:MAG: RHS repeat-associated core domain-containing protein [Planctomycetes bacterium]|nr:RHS repeat-associated core domain-containing protein [Planctomycetota bacterium]
MAALDDLGRARAKYEYGPFGETLTSEGDLAADNPIRWSTKYTDGESGLVYYGYRYYNAGTGRWLSRDPIGERGGLGLLTYVGNRPPYSTDSLGQYEEAGHYYTTFLAATCAGRSSVEAEMLAYYSQLPDEVPALDALSLSKAYLQLGAGGVRLPLANKWLFEIEGLLHSLFGGDPNPRRACLEKLLTYGNLSTWEMGLVTHALQDAYAHVYIDPTTGKLRAYSAPFGHAADSLAELRKYAGIAIDALAPEAGLATKCITRKCPDQIKNYPVRHRQAFIAVCIGFGGSPTKCAGCAGLLPIPSAINPQQEVSMYRSAAMAAGLSGAFVPELHSTGQPGLPWVVTRAQVRSLLSKIKSSCCK